MRGLGLQCGAQIQHPLLFLALEDKSFPVERKLGQPPVCALGTEEVLGLSIFEIVSVPDPSRMGWRRKMRQNIGSLLPPTNTHGVGVADLESHF